jgi:hypothetical protein
VRIGKSCTPEREMASAAAERYRENRRMRPVLAALAALAACGAPIPAVPYCPPASALPPWFGDPSAPPRRVAGHLYQGDQPIVGSVALRIDAPDPTAWAGFDVTTGPAGAFDFGALRPGRYTLLAMAPGRMSRVIELDTRGEPADDVELFVHPCHMRTATIRRWYGAAPIAGARIDIAGVRVATSDADGRFELCDVPGRRHATVRAAGFAALPIEMDWIAAGGARLMPAGDLTGLVVDARGAPVAGAAVTLVHIDPGRDSHGGGGYPPWPLQATTDAGGRFTLREVHAIDHGERFTVPSYLPFQLPGPPRRGQYFFRVWTAERAWVVGDEHTVGRTGAPPVTLRLGDGAPLPRPGPPPPEATIVEGRVLLAGVPLTDARVGDQPISFQGSTPELTHTRRDGTFRLVLGAQSSPARPVGIVDRTGVQTERTVEIAPGRRARLDVDIPGMSTLHVFTAPTDASATIAITARGEPRPIYRHPGRGHHVQVPLERGRVYDVDLGVAPDVRGYARVDLTGASAAVFLAPAAPPHIAGVVVDARGRPVSGATVAISEPAVRGEACRRWAPRNLHTYAAAPRAPMCIVAETASDGRFRVPLAGPDALVVLAVTADGRAGVVDAAPGTPARVVVEPTGRIHATCPRSADAVHVQRGLLAITADCSDHLADLPPGTYRVTADHDPGASSVDAVVTPGRVTTVALIPAPVGPLTVVARSYPDDAPARHVSCDARWPGVNHVASRFIDAADGAVTMNVPRSRLTIRCEGRGGWIAGTTTIDTTVADRAVVPVVARRVDASPAGVAFAHDARGARITRVHGMAAEAGLRPGDLVVAADGVALAPLGADAMDHLAFHVPGAGIAWTVERAGRRLTLRASLDPP